jgi:hypothetical protein
MNENEREQLFVMAIAKLEEAVRIKRINQELYDYLSNSIIWLFEYSERRGIWLPDKQKLVRLIEGANNILTKLTPDESYHREDSDGELPEPSGSAKVYILIARLSGCSR